MGGTWDRRRSLSIAIGGTAGAGLRWAVMTSFDAGLFPWPVLMLNVAGSALLGVLLAEEWDHPAARLALHDAGAIGFCGGLTTFSTFAVEVVDLARSGHVLVAGVYSAASVAAALVAVVGGALLLRRLRALSLPVEERP